MHYIVLKHITQCTEDQDNYDLLHFTNCSLFPFDVVLNCIILFFIILRKLI